MKIIFTLIAMAVMALGVNAQTEAQQVNYSALSSADEFTVSNATSNSASTATRFIYDIAANAVLDFVSKTATNIHFTITNGSAKTKIFNVYINGTETSDQGCVEFGGKNGIVVFDNLVVGDVVKMSVAAKGGTIAKIGVLPSSGNDLITSTIMELPKKSAGAEGADSEGYIYKVFSFTVTEDMLKGVDGIKVVRVKETDAGYRCKLVSINADLPTGIQTVKAVQTADGVVYNLAGQKVGNDFKGIVIKNGVKLLQK